MLAFLSVLPVLEQQKPGFLALFRGKILGRSRPQTVGVNVRYVRISVTRCANVCRHSDGTPFRWHAIPMARHSDGTPFRWRFVRINDLIAKKASFLAPWCSIPCFWPVLTVTQGQA
jgi:hypothetical protein